MERRKEQKISDVLKLFLSENNLETPYLQYKVVQEWKNLVTESVATQSCALEVKNETLHVLVYSPSLCTELQMQKAALVAKLNASVGANVIRDIRFML